MTVTDLGADEVRGLLEESGALERGHFLLSSGLHSDRYVQCALLLELPARARRLGAALAGRLAAYRAAAVVSPALGGLVIGHETAAALGLPFRFAERRDGVMGLRRGFRLQPDSRVVVVEDVVTTGGSVRETLEAVAALGARPVAVGAILDRSGGGNPFEVPFESLLRLELRTFEPGGCPLCRSGDPLRKPGSR